MPKRIEDETRDVRVTIWTTRTRRDKLRAYDDRLNGVINDFLEVLTAGGNVSELELQLIEVENEVRRLSGIASSLKVQLSAARAVRSKVAVLDELEAELRAVLAKARGKWSPERVEAFLQTALARRLGPRARVLVDEHRLKQSRL